MISRLLAMIYIDLRKAFYTVELITSIPRPSNIFKKMLQKQKFSTMSAKRQKLEEELGKAMTIKNTKVLVHFREY